MTDDPRESTLSGAHLKPAATLGGIELRPFSRLDAELVERLDLRLFRGGAGLSQREQTDDIVALAWILSHRTDAEIDALLGDIESGAWKAKLARFNARITVAEVKPLVARFAEMLGEIQAALFDLEPKTVDGKPIEGDPPPGNS